MTTFLLYADALKSHEVRHEIGEPVGDPVVFLEHEGKRIVVGSSLEEAIFEKREDVVDEYWTTFSLGSKELVKDESFPTELIGAEMVLRALQRVGVTKVCIPPSFRVKEADYLRSKGIELVIDDDAWALRRRQKTPWELEGIERAQRAADTAMLTAARMLREAEPTGDGKLRYEGEILTSEWIREVMEGELLTQGAESQEIIVQSGDACLRGHDIGVGPILPHQSCIIDCFPRDRRTGVYTDMTRTFVPGRPSKELTELHAHCLAALELAFETLRPGAKDAHAKVAQYFADRGYPTFKTHQGEGSLNEGFFHSLGHGVGLDVHERPWLGERSDELVEGDVVAVEPGLYFPGVGGVRLEDTVLVTSHGVEHFTDPLPYDLNQ
ncbi:MAG: Xaa-Pro aminopeptidase [Actinomycetota bacterium]|nr:Xaa-Pro aminopeptidase [Actinomycetota bacterium]